MSKLKDDNDEVFLHNCLHSKNITEVSKLYECTSTSVKNRLIKMGIDLNWLSLEQQKNYLNNLEQERIKKKLKYKLPKEEPPKEKYKYKLPSKKKEIDKNAPLITQKKCMNLVGKRFGQLVVLKETYRQTQERQWICRCDCGRLVIKPQYALVRGRSICCPNCVGNMSLGEIKIKNILDELHIKYICQQTFEDCMDIKKLPFDFYLPDLNVLIEYDGQQHFKPVEIFGGEEAFKIRQRHDEIKTKWANDHGIKLIRIPYTDFKLLSKEYITSVV